MMKNMVPSLNQFQQFINKHQQASSYYIDRIDIRVNDLSASTPLRSILRQAESDHDVHNVKFTPIFEQRSHKYKNSGPRQVVGYKLEALQPKQSLLAKLADLILPSHYSISWLEVAYDLNLGSRIKTEYLLKLLIGLIVIPDIKRQPTFNGCEKYQLVEGEKVLSAFFGEYSDNTMFKLYIPKPNEKLYGNKCLHTEFRLKGVAAIRNEGLLTLQDVVEMDHATWYKERVKLYTVNGKRAGALIRNFEGKPPASDRQCQKDFDSRFGKKHALAHVLYQHEEINFKDILKPTRQTWLSSKSIH